MGDGTQGVPEGPSGTQWVESFRRLVGHVATAACSVSGRPLLWKLVLVTRDDNDHTLRIPMDR